MHELTTSDVERAKVYGRDDEAIGSVSSRMVSAGGKIIHAVIDVGGFLGLGAHSAMMPLSALTVLRQTDGTDVRVYLDAMKEKLKALPHHES